MITRRKIYTILRNHFLFVPDQIRRSVEKIYYKHNISENTLKHIWKMIQICINASKNL